ncbi:MAG: T9SS type A sorting domain-containing protein [Tannerella sp.]|jgi:hypothetical protein|nr:T9SS type A sorting domain-containing protein [Tannerella sp.]
MRKKLTLLIVSLAFLLGSSTVWGQQGKGMLLPEYQEHIHGEACGDACCGDSSAEAFERDMTLSLPVVKRSETLRSFFLQQSGNVAPRRGTLGTVSPANPLYPNCDTIGLWYDPIEQYYANTTGYENVNNEFGAGESSTVSTNKVTFPSKASGGLALANLPALRIGSTQSQNIVINTYNAGGYASGWLDINVWITACGTSTTFYPSESKATIIADGLLTIPNSTLNSQISAGLAGQHQVQAGDVVVLANGYMGTPTTMQATASLSSQGGNLGDLDGVMGYATMETLNEVTLYMVQHSGVGNGTTGVYTYNKAMYETPYTSTGGYVSHTPTPNNFPTLQDDGIWLFQYAGNKLISDVTATAASVGTAPAPTGANRYKRPTTVAIAGSNTFNRIEFSDVNWFYQQHEIRPFASGPSAGLYYDTQDWSSRHAWDCCHYVGNAQEASDITAGRDKIEILVTRIPDFTHLMPQVGDGFLDAAVQLLEGARVCVEGSVSDNTTATPTQAAAGDITTMAETNAIITLPVADRVTLRTTGNFKANMTHERDSDMTRAAYYIATEFPDPDPDIYLYVGSSAQGIGQTMKSFSNPQYTTVTTNAPYISTLSSVFGVNGDYQHTGNMAEIHTDSATTFAYGNKGVIEVGTTTAGKTHFHVYGNGMLKNYEGCNISANFPMYFGDTRGGTPSLQINSDDTLYIVNFGNNGGSNCNADLLFHTTSVDSVNNAFAGDGAGALQIQALSDMRLRGDGVWDATAYGNNIYLLSDGGNISTQKLDISNDNIGGVGHGLVTIWAETDSKTDVCAGNGTGNRFSKSGNIYFNDAVTLLRAASETTQTNIIAANNIRTASLTSTNLNDEDTTNIISRMGDLYLGYSANVPIYSGSDAYPTQNGLTGNGNIFSYNGTGISGTLNILAGYDDQANTSQFGGGNIYFTRIHAEMTQGNAHETNITIPFSNEYYCSSAWVTGMLHERERGNGSMGLYEHAGIIGGVGRCGEDVDFSSYGGLLEEHGTAAALVVADTSLIYRANKGNLLVDAGLRGNIIMNQGTYLDFQNDAANAFFLTRSGDIDMRGQTNIDNLQSNVLFLASSEDANKQNTGICGCTEQQNNVYLQDLQQRLSGSTKGSIFIGADNNIKLQYGGLKNIGTQIDPFLSENKGYNGTTCGTSYHCDADTMENKARDLILDFKAQNGVGGMGIVASDLIDIYKNMIYTGGNGSGMGAVPTYNTLHGESVAGYGLYIKSQGNKNNWTKTDFDALGKCGRDCDADDCTDAFLHQTARVTFHADAHLYPENQRVYIGSPVLDTYGTLELNTTQNKGSKTSIMIQTDSLICHDSLVIDGTLANFSTWSNLYRNIPVFKFGHQRFTPPYTEDASVCPSCHTHTKTTGSVAQGTALDSIFVTFRNGAHIPRLHTLVADHTVLSFLTDSFDHVKGNPVINAKFYTDTFKVRNHVELFKTADHTRDGHFELISEAQMESKDYAGIYARHLHMEPISPTCSGTLYSQLWLQDPSLSVITSSTLGGFGTIHADVHVEIEAKLAPGYASLGKEGRCYEQRAGTLSMQDLRLDKGAEIHYTIGDVAGFEGEVTDCIEVDDLTMYGSINIYVEKRDCQNYEPGCYPIIRYKMVSNGDSHLNNLQLGTKKIDGVTLSLNTETPGVVYLCVGENSTPQILREVYFPETPGVTMISPAEYGAYYIPSQGNYKFTVKYDTEQPLKVTTNRMVDGVPEELTGTKNANGEYEYVIYHIFENIELTFGPDFATDNIEIVDGTAVWSHGNTIYIKVEKEDIASIYSIAGQLVKRIELSEGSTSIPMERGVYIVTLKDGSIHKVIIK